MIFKKIKSDLTKYSFGGTSAIITNLALITGLNTAVNAKLSITGSLLVIALADNVSDTLGIHIYQESEGRKPFRVWISTFTNFLARLFISLGFVLIITIFPLNIATVISIVYGLLVLSVISYIIAVNKKINPFQSVLEHVLIAIVIIFISKYLGGLIIGNFKNL
jgi:vacuolar iron transporter family protein